MGSPVSRVTAAFQMSILLGLQGVSFSLHEMRGSWMNLKMSMDVWFIGTLKGGALVDGRTVSILACTPMLGQTWAG